MPLFRGHVDFGNSMHNHNPCSTCQVHLETGVLLSTSQFFTVPLKLLTPKLMRPQRGQTKAWHCTVTELNSWICLNCTQSHWNGGLENNTQDKAVRYLYEYWIQNTVQIHTCWDQCTGQSQTEPVGEEGGARQIACYQNLNRNCTTSTGSITSCFDSQWRSWSDSKSLRIVLSGTSTLVFSLRKAALLSVLLFQLRCSWSRVTWIRATGAAVAMEGEALSAIDGKQ